jgi:hypothetical protein
VAANLPVTSRSTEHHLSTCNFSVNRGISGHF